MAFEPGTLEYTSRALTTSWFSFGNSWRRSFVFRGGEGSGDGIEMLRIISERNCVDIARAS
jgi:hypothetical protein